MYAFDIMLLMKEKRSYLVGRDAKTGKFVPSAKVYKNPEKYVVTRVFKTTRIHPALKGAILPSRNKKRT